MAYAQWMAATLEPVNFTLTIKNATLNWGKFYQYDNKDHELSPADIDKIKIPAGETAIIASCGRSDASSGTEGSFDVYDGETKVGNFYWDCPWGSKRNTATWTGSSSKYITQSTGWNLDSGALGNGKIEIYKK